jgi:hypothetical protein
MHTQPTPLEIVPAMMVPAVETDPWPQRKRDVRTREWRVYEKLLNKLELAIDRLGDSESRGMTPADIARLLELAAKLGRLAAGLPSDHTAHSIQDERSVRVEISAAIKKIYSEPLDALIARIQPPPAIQTSNPPSLVADEVTSL